MLAGCGQLSTAVGWFGHAGSRRGRHDQAPRTEMLYEGLRGPVMDVMDAEVPVAAVAPAMKPALRRGWRDLNTVQFGMAPAHALTLGPMDTATGSFLDLLNGTRGLPLLREEGRRMD